MNEDNLDLTDELGTDHLSEVARLLAKRAEEALAHEEMVATWPICEECGGEGRDSLVKLYPTGHTEVWETCENCYGEGRVDPDNLHDPDD